MTLMNGLATATVATAGANCPVASESCWIPNAATPKRISPVALLADAAQDLWPAAPLLRVDGAWGPVEGNELVGAPQPFVNPAALAVGHLEDEPVRELRRDEPRLGHDAIGTRIRSSRSPGSTEDASGNMSGSKGVRGLLNK
jgi:hypothetical protein